MPMNPRLLVPRAAGGFDPRQITGLSLWLDAADSATLSVSSGSVSQWRDKSGNSHHAAQGTGLNQPDYIASGLNGKPVVRFDGVNHFILGSQAVIGTNPVTVFFVGKTGGTSATAYIAYLGAGAGANMFFSGDRAVRFGNGNRIWNTGPLTTATLATYRNTSAQYDTFQSWDKGSLLTPSSTSSGTNSYNISAVIFGLGGNPTGGVNLSAGDIGEFLVYTRSLSDAERERVEAALLRKWGF
jgi:hypothetical protein